MWLWLKNCFVHKAFEKWLFLISLICLKAEPPQKNGTSLRVSQPGKTDSDQWREPSTTHHT